MTTKRRAPQEKYRISFEVHPCIFFEHLIQLIEDDSWEPESGVSTNAGEESINTGEDKNDEESKEQCHQQDSQGLATTKRDSLRLEEEKGRKTTSTKRTVSNTAA